MIDDYRQHVDDRSTLGIPPKPLTAEQVAGLIDSLRDSASHNHNELINLLSERVPPGVDEAAYVKASFLSSIAMGKETNSFISPESAVELLGNMHGGYNIATLIDLLDIESLASLAAEQLKNTILMFDAFYDVAEKSKHGNKYATDVINSWAEAEWFTSNPAVPDSIKLVVFKVTGETNTDDLSPAPDAWSRPDIPLHALAMFKMERDGIFPDKVGEIGPISKIKELQEKGYPIAFVGDVVGTGSSRKSATNSVLWYFGNDIDGVPNKRNGGVCIGGKGRSNFL